MNFKVNDKIVITTDCPWKGKIGTIVRIVDDATISVSFGVNTDPRWFGADDMELHNRLDSTLTDEEMDFAHDMIDARREKQRNTMIKIYNRMGEFVAGFGDVVGAATALATVFDGCWYLDLDQDPDGIDKETAAEVEKLVKEFRRDYLDTLALPNIKLAALDTPTDHYHRASMEDDGIHLFLGRAYGLESGYEARFGEMVGQTFHRVIFTKEHITLVWIVDDTYHSYSLLKK